MITSATELIYLTGNDFKFAVAERALGNSGIVLVQECLEAPEIQSSRVEDVATYAAEWGSQRLDRPVVVTDAGFYIEALNGFPGPFVKFVNRWLTAEDLLNLMRGKDNRRAITRDCLAYCRSGEKPAIFSGSYPGCVAAAPGAGGGTPMEQVFIPDGYAVPVSDFPADERLAFWSRADVWVQLKRFLRG
jgi:XTP/dITP diphosphohydrolase